MNKQWTTVFRDVKFSMKIYHENIPAINFA